MRGALFPPPERIYCQADPARIVLYWHWGVYWRTRWQSITWVGESQALSS